MPMTQQTMSTMIGNTRWMTRPLGLPSSFGCFSAPVMLALTRDSCLSLRYSLISYIRIGP